MKTKYHIEITTKALSDKFTEKALGDVIQGNIQQDRIKNQFGHDYIHFDGSAFETGFSYLMQQKQDLIDHLSHDYFTAARFRFGRITHSWQDFYSHSNYVKLWRETAGNIPPEEIVINDPIIMDHPELKSGKNYGLIEFFALIPPFSKWIKPIMPEDSHAKMNLDGPEVGEYFAFAYHAALKQTVCAFQELMTLFQSEDITQKKVRSFLGK